jgi:hypothetical protein
MRKTAIAVMLAIISSLPALAQQAPGIAPGEAAPSTAPPPSPPTAGAAPAEGSPMLPGTQTGLDKVADDGISTKTVPSVRCSTSAKETDGTTTCVGIPEGSLKSNRR